MDKFDIKILDFLQNNAKLTAKELASKLSLTPTPIYERIKKMEKSGIIKKYVAILEPDLLNKSLVVFMNITIKEHDKISRAKFIANMSALKNVSECYHTSGTFDFLVKVRFSSVKEYKNFLVEDVASIANIGDIDSQIVLEEIKSSTNIILE
jgi:DNA-binding Lrp family transcriptional regulator